MKLKIKILYYLIVEFFRAALKSLYKIKKVANATHNMYAYRISRGNGNFNSDCDDDRETNAGSRLLHLLEVKT